MTVTGAALVDLLRDAGVSRILTRDDDAYATELAAFNLSFRLTPDVVVAAASARDVEIAVAVAARSGTTIAVVGLGHGISKDILEGIAVTTRGLAHVDVDVQALTARVGAGTSWAQVLGAVTPFGLAALCGSAPGVGVVGYTLGGGIGPIARTYGFTADHVRSFEIVTPADGLITVTAESHPDLFWALRGGKGGFGIVTALTVDLFPVREVYGGGIFFAADDAARIAGAFGDWSETMPESVTASFALLRLPPIPDLPEPIRGKNVVHVRFAALEEPAAAERLLSLIRSLGTPLLDSVGVLPYSAIGSIHSDPVQPVAATEGGITLSSFGPDAAAALLAAAGLDTEVPLAAVEVRALGGALSREAQVPNAVGGRDSAFIVHVVSEPDSAQSKASFSAAVRGVLAALEPWRAPTLLINFVGRSNAPGAEIDSWTPEVNDRLDAIRSRADPGGLFPIAGHG